MREVFTSSEAMKSISVSRPSFEIKYPWIQLKVGESFVVQKTEAKLSSLRSMVSRAQKKYGKKFKVAVHEGCYEVGRVQ